MPQQMGDYVSDAGMQSLLDRLFRQHQSYVSSFLPYLPRIITLTRNFRGFSCTCELSVLACCTGLRCPLARVFSIGCPLSSLPRRQPQVSVPFASVIGRKATRASICLAIIISTRTASRSGLRPVTSALCVDMSYLQTIQSTRRNERRSKKNKKNCAPVSEVGLLLLLSSKLHHLHL